MNIEIDTEYIKLDSALKLAELVNSGGEAKEIVKNGEVSVNGEIETRRGRKLREGDSFTFNGITVFVRKK